MRPVARPSGLAKKPRPCVHCKAIVSPKEKLSVPCQGIRALQKQKGNPMRKITEIIIHCTATRPDAECTVESIRRYHRSLGWHDIGYHYVIYPDGSVHSGRPVEQAGAHCPGHNARRRTSRRHPHRSPTSRPPSISKRPFGRAPHHLHPRPQRVCQPYLPLFRRPTMEKGEQSLTAESGIIYKIYKISCAVRRIGEYQDLLKYEQPLEPHSLPAHSRRRWRLALRPTPPPAGGRERISPRCMSTSSGKI